MPHAGHSIMLPVIRCVSIVSSMYSIYIYICIYVYFCVYTYIYIYIYIYPDQKDSSESTKTHLSKCIVDIFYPFSQFCEKHISLLSLQTQPKTAPNLFQRGVEYGKYEMVNSFHQHGPCARMTRTNREVQAFCKLRATQ